MRLSRLLVWTSTVNVDQEEGTDPHGRMLAEDEEHLVHSHTVELGHTHTQLAGVHWGRSVSK